MFNCKKSLHSLAFVSWTASNMTAWAYNRKNVPAHIVWRQKFLRKNGEGPPDSAWNNKSTKIESEVSLVTTRGRRATRVTSGLLKAQTCRSPHRQHQVCYSFNVYIKCPCPLLFPSALSPLFPLGLHLNSNQMVLNPSVSESPVCIFF